MSEGVMISEDLLARIGRAVKWVEENMGRSVGRDVPQRAQAESYRALCTSATPDGNGHFPATITVWDQVAGAWVLYDAVKLKSPNGESLVSGQRYKVTHGGANPAYVPLFVVDTVPGGGGAITVREIDDSPIVTNVVNLAFDTTFIVSQISAGLALVNIQNATPAIRGVVTTGTQTFGGEKIFLDGVTLTGQGGQLYSSILTFRHYLEDGIVEMQMDAQLPTRTLKTQINNGSAFTYSVLSCDPLNGGAGGLRLFASGTLKPGFSVQNPMGTEFGQYGTIRSGATVTGGIVTNLGNIVGVTGGLL